MFDTITDTWETFTTTAFSLKDVDGFPYELWEEQLSKYEEAERWFNGSALDDQPEAPNAKTDLYPLRINPLLSTCLKHAYALFGEVEDDGRPLVVTKFVTNGDAEKALAETAEEALNQVWWESNGRAIMIENGILSQVYGGAVFKATYVPWEDVKTGGTRTIPIRIERINPKGFVGIPDSSDMYRLSEAWFVKPILTQEARRWGYKGEDKVVWFIEHWLKDKYTLNLNDRPVTKILKGDEEHPLGGKNPWGVVPAVYIPHLRVGTFLGINAIDHLKGLVKEMNLRYGDYGDAVNDDSHSTTAMRNVQGSAKIKKVGSQDVVDLGTTQGITGNEPEPDMFEVRKTRASTAMQNLLQEIYGQYRRDAFIPAVADGEDEGSQRSAMTLAMRFWPLGSHVSTERLFWTPALDVFQNTLLRMMSARSIGEIKEEHTKMRMKQKWAPLLPRDREADVQEWVTRAAANLGSIEHLLELTGDIEDVQEEREAILKWIEDVKEIEAKLAAKYPVMQAGPPQRGGSSSTSKPTVGGTSP